VSTFIDRRRVLAAEQQLASAHATHDLRRIATLLHDDYRILQPNGTVETKADVLASYADDDRHWDRAEVGDLTVTLHGPVAQVVGIWRASGSNNAVAFDYRARFLSTWLKEGDEWRNLSYTSAELPPEGDGASD
jgi:ketosteroid isomerase-like protein